MIRAALFLSLLASGCMTPSETRSADPESGTLRFLALGDSYTIGEAVSEAERWPVQLAVRLRARGLNAADPVIVATTGWTTDELDAGIDQAAAEGRVAGTYDLVSLLIGVNNQYRGRDLEEYRAQFRALLGRAIGFAGHEASNVMVLSIPDWGVTSFAGGRDRAQIGREIDAFNAVAREEAAQAGAHFLDITTASRAHPEEVAADGLHPSGAQYTRWADAAVPLACAILGGCG